MHEAYGWLAFLVLWLLCLAIPAVFIELRREYRQFLKYRRARDRWHELINETLRSYW